MNDFDFGFKGTAYNRQGTAGKDRYLRGINISKCSDEQIKEAIKRGYLKKKRLSKQDIKDLQQVLEKRKEGQEKYSPKQLNNNSYLCDRKEIPQQPQDSKIQERQAVANAQQWFLRRKMGRSEKQEKTLRDHTKEQTLLNNESNISGSFTEDVDAYSGLYGLDEDISGEAVRHGRISEKAYVLTGRESVSEKVRVISSEGVPVRTHGNYSSMLRKAAGSQKKYYYMAKAGAAAKGKYLKRITKKKASKTLIGSLTVKKTALPALMAGGGAAFMCAALFPFASMPLLNPNSAITNSNLSIEDTPLQQGIDYTEEYLQAYEENIFCFDPESERSATGIPKPWVLSDVMADSEDEQMVHKDPTAYYGDAEYINESGIIGYNIGSYWGPKSFKYKTSVTCTCDKCKAEDEHGKSYTVILKGTAGLRGNASSDGTLYGEGGEGWDGDTYTGYISEGSETYGNRTPEDNDYRLTHKYQGSMYSEYRKRTEYEPIEVLRTSRKYIQGTPKEDPTEGIGNAANSVVDNTKMARVTYYPTQLIDYTKTQMYHAFAVMAIGISHNADECRKFFKKYMKKTYDLECNYAMLTLKTYPQSDDGNLVAERDYDNGEGWKFSPILRGEEDKIKFNIELPCGNVIEEAEIDHSYKARGFLNIEYKYCSIQDLIRLEEEDVDWVEKTTNEWLHNEEIHETQEEMAEYGQEALKKTDVYSVIDEDNIRYKYWNEKNKEGTWIGWFTSEKDGLRSAYLDHAMNHYELTDEDWEYGYPELTWPYGVTDNFEETSLKQYRKKKLKPGIKSLTEDIPDGTLPPEFIYPNVEGSNVLSMFMYLNQGDYSGVIRGSSGETVQQSGCLDCSVAMIAMYYTRQNIPIQNISRFANSKGQLDAPSALAQYGLRQGSNTYSNFAGGVMNEIDSGRPPIVHIRGRWVSSDGTVLHKSSNGHFMVATGYDKTGIYVYDPGRRANHHISYSDWATVGDLYYRPVYAK